MSNNVLGHENTSSIKPRTKDWSLESTPAKLKKSNLTPFLAWIFGLTCAWIFFLVNWERWLSERLEKQRLWVPVERLEDKYQFKETSRRYNLQGRWVQLPLVWSVFYVNPHAIHNETLFQVFFLCLLSLFSLSCDPRKNLPGQAKIQGRFDLNFFGLTG